MSDYLKVTPLLDFNSKDIQDLIQSRKWQNLNDYHKIEQIYNFVKDEIAFGYNQMDAMRASAILKEGFGQCNTKSILLMALLRGVGIPCRLHGFTIDKALQKGAISGIWYKLAPQEIIHSWVEIQYEDEWLNLEGFILDQAYLKSVQDQFRAREIPFKGYGIATDNFKYPQIKWCGTNTYIQKEGISKDFGVFDQPDTFFSKYGQALSPIKQFVFKHITRHNMNRNVDKIRQKKC